MARASTLQQLSLDGRLLWDVVRRASACSEVAILCTARDRNVTFISLNGVNLIFSWRLRLPESTGGSVTFLIPPMIVSHLLSALPQTADAVSISLNKNEVSLASRDGVGSYELRWRFDLHGFPAPPGMSQFLALPPVLIRKNYLQVMDSVHRAVARLGTIESQYQIHRTKLAISLGLPDGSLIVEGKKICDQAGGEYYFDPRLLIRALESVDVWQIELGLTKLNSQRGYLSIVNRQPEWVMHCALLSVALDAPWLPPLLPSRHRQGRLQGLSTWNL